jgi:UDP-glucose 4-epimerase
VRILVTGGAGFIGSALVDRLLAEGHDVDVADDLSTGSLANLAAARAERSRRLSIQRIDVRFPGCAELIVHRKPEVIFHLAAPLERASLARPLVDAEVNLIGTLHLLQGAVSAGTSKVVFASSASVYGPPDDVPVREGHPQRPETPSAVAKKAIVDYLHFYRQVHGLEYTALILGDVYGPRQQPDGGIVAELGTRLVAKERPVLPGDGTQTRDFLFVDDAVDAFARALDHGGGLAVNIASGTETAVVDLYERIAALAEVDDPPRLSPARSDEIPRLCLDPGRASIHLGWKPWTPLDEGLAKTVDWIREEQRAARTRR